MGKSEVALAETLWGAFRNKAFERVTLSMYVCMWITYIQVLYYNTEYISVQVG